MQDKKITWDTICKHLKITQYSLVNDYIIKPIKDCIKDTNYPTTTKKGGDIFKYNKSGDATLTRFISGKYKTRSEKYLEIITNPDVTLETYSGNLLDYSEYIYLKNVMNSWKLYIKNNPDSKSVLEELINTFYESFKTEQWSIYFTINNTKINLIDKLLFIENENDQLQFSNEDLLVYQFSIFSIIATTWPIWEICSTMPSQNDKNDKVEYYKTLLYTLVQLIFPLSYDEISKKTHTSNKSPYDYSAKDKLDKAMLFLQTDNYQAAGDLLTDIIIHYSSLTSKDTIRIAYDKLDLCRQHNYKTPNWLNSSSSIEYEATRYGSKNTTKTSYNIKPKEERANSLNSGLYYMKCSNKEIAHWITSTIPCNWTSLAFISLSNTKNQNDFNLHNILYNYTIVLKNNIRFIFAEDSFDENINDALNVLNELKGLIDFNISSPKDWGNIEIIIRCEQETVTPIIDTACSFLPEKLDDDMPGFEYNPIKIHILDEKKRTADLLYANHPLFYPLTTPRIKEQIHNFQKNSDNATQKKPNFNLVIVSDNIDIDYTVWLIRQAFWLLPHLNIPITSKITVLSPYAKDILNRTSSICPGFAQFSTNTNNQNIKVPKEDIFDIKDLCVPAIEYHTINMESPNLQEYIKTFIAQEDILYYVIDSSSDLYAIQIGMKIRKLSIRRALNKKQLKYYTPDSTIITVRCSNPTYANLTNQLIVPKETEHDNLWFNDYKLIPFGSINELFSWDELTGGTIEFMSLCIHLQYCTPSDKKCDYTKKPSNQDIWSYYRRMYNRDSSYAAAISLPYRLFEAGVVLSPLQWQFYNKQSLWSKENRKILSEMFSKVEDIEALCKWEHNRFCCYLLSTGWLPAIPDQTRYYMNNGVTRHTLQIAQLHPCLCSWNDLKIDLYFALHAAYKGQQDAYGNYKKPNNNFIKFKDDDETYFQKFDIDNIKQTGDILRAEPILELERSREDSFELIH